MRCTDGRMATYEDFIVNRYPVRVKSRTLENSGD
jgi:hypothetical protein